MDGSRTEVPLIWQGASENASQHAQWIAGRVLTLLSHYFQPDNPAEIQEAAVEDWVEALQDFSQPAIDAACKRYLVDQPRRRPTPGDIRAKVREPSTTGRTSNTGLGDRSKLTPDELNVLGDQILPTARRWVRDIPELAEQGRSTLAYWGEQA